MLQERQNGGLIQGLDLVLWRRELWLWQRAAGLAPSNCPVSIHQLTGFHLYDLPHLILLFLRIPDQILQTWSIRELCLIIVQIVHFFI